MCENLGNDSGPVAAAPEDTAAGLDSGLLAVGPDVVAVVSMRLRKDDEGGLELVGSLSHRAGLPVEVLAAALHDMSHELLDEAERAELDGEAGAGA